MEINDVALARGANVDRRSIRATVDVIMDDPELAAIFGNIFPAGALLKNVASDLGFGVVEIEAQAGTTGILATATHIISEQNISIRQAHAGDPELKEHPNSQ